MKVALDVPCDTATPEGTINALLELEMPTVRFPAEADKATIQLLLAPTAIFTGLQVSEDRFGVDQSSIVAFCDELLRTAVTTA